MGKKTFTFAYDDIIRQLEVLNKERESTRSQLEVTAKKLAVVAKEKEDVRKKLAVVAKEKEDVRKKLAVVAKEKEDVRKELAVIAKELKLKATQLAVVAKEKESIRKDLAVIAKEKEDVRKDLAITAEQLKLKDEQLVVTNKEIESFSYSVSHDLRAPLRAIDGFTQILAEQYGQKLDDEGKRITSIIRSSTVQMGKLIDDLLSFSRLGHKEITKNHVTMGLLVDEIYRQLITSSPERKREFILGALPDAKADLDMMRVVWTNLLSNAIKFTGKIPTAKIEIGSKENEKEITYYVKDNGAGFDVKYIDKLFGVFQRLHSVEEFEGTGVGLANVKRIIERHGGKVWAEGKVGQGATIYFSLPKL